MAHSYIIPTGELIDDWRLITCETALEIAIKNGHIKVVKLLLDTFPNGLFCRQYSGLTPVLSAVYHSKLEILKILLARGGSITDRCKKKQYISSRWQEMLDKSEKDNYMAINCPEGATIAHLCAIFNILDIAHYIYSIGYTQWETKDSFGITPAHYAASHGSVQFLEFLSNIANIDVINTATENGLTPIHSAASCDCLVVLEWFLNKNIYLLLDNNGNSVLHYALMQGYDDILAKYAEKTNKMTSVSLIIEKQSHLLEAISKNGKTALHFIAANGIFNCIEILLDPLTKEERKRFLLTQDRDGNDILELSFNNLIPKNYKLYPFQMTKCPLTEIYENTCNFDYDLRDILSAYELTIVKYLKYIHDLEIIHLFNITKHIETAVIKRNFHILVALKIYAPQEFDSVMRNQPTRLINMYLTSEGGPGIAELLLSDQMLRCGKSLLENPIHNIIMNNENKFWYHSPRQNEELLVNTVKRKNASFLDNCYDSEGFNILHRAMVGGHVSAVKYLISNIGMKLTVKIRNGTNLLLKTAEQFTNIVLKEETYFYLAEIQNRHQITIMNDINSTKNYEGMIAFLLRHEKNLYIPKRVICNEEKSISLIHIAAAKGLISLLEYSFHHYGKDVLKCENIHKFTPLYFAKVFDQNKAVEFMINKGLLVKYPLFLVEMNFILKLYHKFEIPFAAESSFWKCKLLKTYPIIARLIHKYFKCVYNLLKEIFGFIGYSLIPVAQLKYLKTFSNYSRLLCYTDEHNYFLYNETEYVRICLIANARFCEQEPEECIEILSYDCQLRYRNQDIYKFELRLLRGRNIRMLNFFFRDLQQMVLKSSIMLFLTLSTQKSTYINLKNDKSFDNIFIRSRYAEFQKLIGNLNLKISNVLKHKSGKILRSFINRQFKYLDFFKNFGFNHINFTNESLKDLHVKILRLTKVLKNTFYNITQKIGATDFPLIQPLNN